MYKRKQLYLIGQGTLVSAQKKTTTSTTMHSYFNRKHTESDKEVTAEKDAAQFELASHVDLDDQHFRLSPPNSREGEY